MKYLFKINFFVCLFFFTALSVHAQNTGFVPLAPITGLTDTNTVNQGLIAFLNSLYTFCIGAAVVLAVIQIIRGGIEYMGGESITNKETGRNHITQAILGLILVLSPVIVFGIINKDITSLNFAIPNDFTIDPGGNLDQTENGNGFPTGTTQLTGGSGEQATACATQQGCQVVPRVAGRGVIQYECQCAAPETPTTLPIGVTETPIRASRGQTEEQAFSACRQQGCVVDTRRDGRSTSSFCVCDTQSD